jgi:ABC-type phosphate transport system substrate-binding protein
VNKTGTSPETLEFLDWILDQGGNYLHDSGYIFPEPEKTDGEKPDQLARKQKP